MKIDKIVKLLKVSKSKQCVIVCFSHFQKSSKKTELICGEVSASFNDDWIVNRAIVKPESLRGHGIGSLMLTKLKFIKRMAL